jgi:hypothetical protein
MLKRLPNPERTIPRCKPLSLCRERKHAITPRAGTCDTDSIGIGDTHLDQSVAQRMFPSVDAVNRRLMWTDPVMLQFGCVSGEPHRIVGVAADIDDENIVPGPAMSVYHPLGQSSGAGRLFVHSERTIRTRWSRRSRALFARCRRSSLSNGLQPWRMYAPRCSHPID